MVFGSNAESGGKKKCCEGMYFDLDSLSYVLFHESVATLPNYKMDCTWMMMLLLLYR